MHAAGEGPFPEGVTMPGDHLRKVFYRMGFNDQEIVALSGAQSAHSPLPCMPAPASSIGHVSVTYQSQYVTYCSYGSHIRMVVVKHVMVITGNLVDQLWVMTD